MEVIAHRGYSDKYPENTLVAFRKAVEENVEAIEFDVQMTKDGHIVVIHDYELGRTVPLSGLVIDNTLEELQSASAGAWFDQKYEAERVPTLQQVLDLIPENIEVHIELKQLGLDSRDMISEMLRIVEESRSIETCVFSSFNHHVLSELSKKANIRLAVLISSNLIAPLKYLEENGLKGYSYNVSADVISSGLINECHKDGLKVFVYTINKEPIALQLKAMGVDGVFTNDITILGEHNDH